MVQTAAAQHLDRLAPIGIRLFLDRDSIGAVCFQRLLASPPDGAADAALGFELGGEKDVLAFKFPGHREGRLPDAAAMRMAGIQAASSDDLAVGG